MPANEPYRRFDENGNWQPPPARAGFYEQNPQYANARLQNPKGHPDGPFTEAGRALENWERSQGRRQTTSTKPQKRTRIGPGSRREQNRQAQQNTVTATQTGQADSSQSDFMAKGPGPAAAATASSTNQYGDPSDRVYAGGSPTFNESTGRYEDYTGADGTVTKGNNQSVPAFRLGQSNYSQPSQPTSNGNNFRKAGDIFKSRKEKNKGRQRRTEGKRKYGYRNGGGSSDYMEYAR